MAPELLENRRYTNKTDIWALAVVFYQLLFNDFPFNARSEAELKQVVNANKIDF